MTSIERLGQASDRTGSKRPWIGLLTLRALLVVALVPLGSTGRYAMPVTTLLLSLWCAGVFLSNWRLRFLSGLSLAMAGALAVYIVLQFVPDLGWMRPHPLWAEASALLGTSLPQSVSVAPAISLATLPIILLPFLVFSATVQLLRDDEQAVALISFMAIAGTITALFGILQLALAPEALLFLFEKRHYTDSLTAVFVNRNSAATFLGCTLMLLAGLIASLLAGRPPFKTFAAVALDEAKTRSDWLLLSYAAAVFVVVVALFLTKSRAGVASTGAGLVLMTLLMTAARRPGEPSGFRGRLSRIGQSLGITSIFVLMAIVLFGTETVRRAQIRGFDDARFCFYGDIWRAGLDAWPFGTGAGTFQLAFAPYRNPECGIYGILDRAHNFYLEGFMTLGIAFVLVGAVAYSTLIYTMAHGVIERRRLRFVPASGLSVLLLVSVHDLIDFSIQIPAIAIWVSVMLATACASASRKKSV